MAAVASEKMMDLPATSSSVPPIPQSMDGSSSSTHFSVATNSPSGELATESLDRPSTSTSGSSPSKQIESKSHLSSKVEEYRQLFRLPPDEDLIQDFNCALQENFLLQGHMYLFVHCICFYSNLFGFETKKTIPFHEITSVRRANAVAVFPTAIEIIAGGKKYFFTSFLSRDEAFRLINDGWLLHSNGSKETSDTQELKSDIRSVENENAVLKKSESFKHFLDEVDVIKSENDDSAPEDSKTLSVSQPEIVLLSSEMQIEDKENGEAAQTINCPPSDQISAWQPEDADAPGIPESYKKVAESKFPIQVEEFFQLFLSDNGVSFQESFHSKCGDKDFKCSSWKPHDKFGQVCEASFKHPIKIYLGARFGSCKQTQKYRVYKNSYLIFETSQVINDVPYGDYFSVEARWDVEKDVNDSSHGCIMRVYVNVFFSKKTMWRGKIVQSTEEECREAYAIWMKLAHEVVKQKNLEKEEGVVLINQVPLEKLENTEISLELKANDAQVSSILPSFESVNERVTVSPGENPGDASVGYVLRNTLTRFRLSFKHQNTSSLLIVITIAIILLMQISIVVLLSRPQKIHVITQADYTGSTPGMSENRAEVITSLKKQIIYLKEEMHFIETMLERMQHEHALLRRRLNDLEL